VKQAQRNRLWDWLEEKSSKKAAAAISTSDISSSNSTSISSSTSSSSEQQRIPLLILEIGCGKSIHGLRLESELLLSEHPQSGIRGSRLIRVDPGLDCLPILSSSDTISTTAKMKLKRTIIKENLVKVEEGKEEVREVEMETISMRGKKRQAVHQCFSIVEATTESISVTKNSRQIESDDDCQDKHSRNNSSCSVSSSASSSSEIKHYSQGSQQPLLFNYEEHALLLGERSKNSAQVTSSCGRVLGIRETAVTAIEGIFQS
jgi:hypothetical protein